MKLFTIEFISRYHSAAEKNAFRQREILTQPKWNCYLLITGNNLFLISVSMDDTNFKKSNCQRLLGINFPLISWLIAFFTVYQPKHSTNMKWKELNQLSRLLRENSVHSFVRDNFSRTFISPKNNLQRSLSWPGISVSVPIHRRTFPFSSSMNIFREIVLMSIRHRKLLDLTAKKYVISFFSHSSSLSTSLPAFCCTITYDFQKVYIQPQSSPVSLNPDLLKPYLSLKKTFLNFFYSK